VGALLHRDAQIRVQGFAGQLLRRVRLETGLGAVYDGIAVGKSTRPEGEQTSSVLSVCRIIAEFWAVLSMRSPPNSTLRARRPAAAAVVRRASSTGAYCFACP
jgi:hypothetical protein